MLTNNSTILLLGYTQEEWNDDTQLISASTGANQGPHSPFRNVQDHHTHEFTNHYRISYRYHASNFLEQEMLARLRRQYSTASPFLHHPKPRSRYHRFQEPDHNLDSIKFTLTRCYWAAYSIINTTRKPKAALIYTGTTRIDVHILILTSPEGN